MCLVLERLLDVLGQFEGPFLIRILSNQTNGKHNMTLGVVLVRLTARLHNMLLADEAAPLQRLQCLLLSSRTPAFPF